VEEKRLPRLLGRTAWLIGGVGFFLLALAPYSGIKSLTFFFLLAKFFVLVQCFNMVAGYVGYISFGHVVFFGIGGYLAAVLVKNLNFVDFFYSATLIMSGLGTMVFAILLGYPLLKLRGAYFAIATLALNEAMKVVIYNLPEEYGGGSFGIPVPQIRDPIAGYYSMLVLAVFVSLVTYFVMVRSRYGIILKTIREDEDAAAVMGINALLYKVSIFALSAFFMGVAGAVDLQYTSYIYPDAAFNVDSNVEVIVMTMLGGNGTVMGPLLGAAILFTLGDYIWAKLPFSHLILLGVILVILVLFMRRGVLGTLEDKVPGLRGGIK
jgi:branched-chain amino acid transport system permease protein